jgi:hypothetical protein
MAKGIGRIFQIGIAKESSRGTAQSAATFWIPFAELALEEKDTKLFDEQSYGVIEDSIGSTIAKQWAEGTMKAPIGDKHFALILLSALGSVSSALHSGETTVYDHTITVQQGSQHQSMTLFLDDPLSGVDYKHALGVVESLEILYELGKYASYTAKIRAQKGASTTNTPSLSVENRYTHKYLTFKTASNLAGLSAGTAIQLTSLTLTITKNLEDDDVLGSLAPNDFLNKQFVIEGKLEATWQNESDFKTNTLAGTQKAIRIQLINTDVTLGSAANPSITIDLAKVTFHEITRPIQLNNVVKQSVTFKAHYSTTDTKMITALITNLVTSY